MNLFPETCDSKCSAYMIAASCYYSSTGYSDDKSQILEALNKNGVLTRIGTYMGSSGAPLVTGKIGDNILVLHMYLSTSYIFNTNMVSTQINYAFDGNFDGGEIFGIANFGDASIFTIFSSSTTYYVRMTSSGVVSHQVRSELSSQLGEAFITGTIGDYMILQYWYNHYMEFATKDMVFVSNAEITGWNRWENMMLIHYIIENNGKALFIRNYNGTNDVPKIGYVSNGLTVTTLPNPGSGSVFCAYNAVYNNSTYSAYSQYGTSGITNVRWDENCTMSTLDISPVEVSASPDDIGFMSFNNKLYQTVANSSGIQIIEHEY